MELRHFSGKCAKTVWYFRSHPPGLSRKHSLNQHIPSASHALMSIPRTRHSALLPLFTLYRHCSHAQTCKQPFPLQRSNFNERRPKDTAGNRSRSTVPLCFDGREGSLFTAADADDPLHHCPDKGAGTNWSGRDFTAVETMAGRRHTGVCGQSVGETRWKGLKAGDTFPIPGPFWRTDIRRLKPG
uniref:Uncharacterized protein n=1 Tax=Steinernema glaseri TaxID=37863 RepID=A0A1I7Y1K1_9BILA